jgi:hypothetical protein
MQPNQNTKYPIDDTPSPKNDIAKFWNPPPSTASREERRKTKQNFENTLTKQNFTHLPRQRRATHSEKLLTKGHKHTMFSKQNPPNWGNSKPQPGNIIQIQLMQQEAYIL